MPPASEPKSGSDRKSTRLNSSHITISYAVFCLKKKTCRSARRSVSIRHPADSARLTHTPDNIRGRLFPHRHADLAPAIQPLVHAYCFFFNDTATTEIYTLSLHDALPISCWCRPGLGAGAGRPARRPSPPRDSRSEEHTSELQSHHELVCRLLLEKKK